MKSFLICPVRGMPENSHWRTVSALEADGYKVHSPPRDTNQDDPIGLRICRDNAAAIADADVVHVIWDGKSQGCLFDLGVAFALNKKIIPLDLPPATDGKSFQNMIRAWASAFASRDPDGNHTIAGVYCGLDAEQSREVDRKWASEGYAFASQQCPTGEN